MPPSFKPPGVDSLARVDPQGIAYEDDGTVIDGVVSPRARASWTCWPEADYHVHAFSLAAWREPGQAPLERELAVLWPVPGWIDGRHWLEAVFERLPTYSIHRFRALLSRDRTRAVLEAILPLEALDPDHVRCAERLREPVVVPTACLGDLVLNRHLGQFWGKVPWKGEAVEIIFMMEDRDELRDAIRTAERFCANQHAWDRRLLDYAVERLLPLKNGAWREEGEPEWPAEALRSRLELQGMTIDRSGQLSFVYHPNPVPRAYGIEIHASLEQGVIGATIMDD
jgi:hypothetical protein